MKRTLPKEDRLIFGPPLGGLMKRTTPKEDGWYWCRYQGKFGVIICPCLITHYEIATVISTARNDTWISKRSKWAIKIGPMIPLPKKF